MDVGNFNKNQVTAEFTQNRYNNGFESSSYCRVQILGESNWKEWSRTLEMEEGGWWYKVEQRKGGGVRKEEGIVEGFGEEVRV